MRHNVFDSISSNIVSDKDNVFADFLQKAGLYDSMKISEDNIQDSRTLVLLIFPIIHIKKKDIVLRKKVKLFHMHMQKTFNWIASNKRIEETPLVPPLIIA